jgi:hypothetical protein
MEVPLNGFRGEAVTGFFAEDSKREMEVIVAIKDQKGMVMFDSFWARSKPVRGHLCDKTPFSYSWMSSGFYYIAERPIGQCVNVIYYIGVYCVQSGAGERETAICTRIEKNPMLKSLEKISNA